MAKPLLRTDKEIADIYTRHGNMVYRVCFSYMKNPADTEDAVQDTFIKLIRSGPAFESEEHEKAWLLRTAANTCKNALKLKWREHDNIDDHSELSGEGLPEPDDTLAAVMGLPDKYKIVVYMYYYEGYSSVEIADILEKPKSTIRNYLHEARMLLRERLGDDIDEE